MLEQCRVRAVSFTTAILVLTGAMEMRAQDTDPRFHRPVRYDDDSTEVAWKISSPAGPSDYFSVDLQHDIDGETISAILLDSQETNGLQGQWARMGIFENCAPGVPDLTLPIATRTNAPVFANDPLGDLSGYSVSCTTLGSPTFGYSVVLADTPGDSQVWLGSDTNGALTGRSNFSTSAYAGCTAVPAGSNWVMGAGLTGRAGELLVNGGASTSISQNGGEACFTFYGPTVKTPGIFYLLSPLVFRILNITTDAKAPGPCPGSWALCTTFHCDDVAFPRFTMGHFYLDFVDTKPSGKPKIKLSNTVDVRIFADQACNGGGCFGTLDDCIMDGFVWKVQDPSGPSDWFNVNHGLTNNVATSLTGVEIASWDFCGIGPSWAEVGLYPANLAVDPSGCSTDVSAPLGTVGGSSAAMAPGATDWGCPMTFYDTPDFAANSSTIYHVAAQWPAGDTCIWLGSDTDGFDNACGSRIPNNGCLSLFSADAYATPGTQFTGANWMMQIRWQ